MSILFSAIGFVDPISKKTFNKKFLIFKKKIKETINDGPMFNILRYYNISKCYLFVTKYMSNRIPYIQDAIEFLNRTLNKNIEYIFFKEDIEEAHDYDKFYKCFKDKLEEIIKDNPDEKIYVNISSGTPQMGNTLLLLSTIYKNITPLQVLDPYPNNKKNSDPKIKLNDFEKNQDNSNGKSRVIEPKLLVQHGFNAKQKIIQLIQKYDYESALYIYNSTNLESKELYLLLEHLTSRKKLERFLSNGILQNQEIMSNVDLYNDFSLEINSNKNLKRKSKLLEYYNVVKTMYYSDKIDEFLVSIMVLLINLQEELFSAITKMKKEKIIKNKDNKDYKISSSLIKSFDKENNTNLHAVLDNEYNGKFRDTNPNNKTLKIINSYLAYEFKCPNASKISEILEDADKLRDFRNDAAHELSFSKKALLDANVDIGKPIEEKFMNIEYLFKLIYPDIREGYFDFYDNVNNYLLELLK